MIYQIRIEGHGRAINVHLDPTWTDWFDGLSITSEDTGDTPPTYKGPFRWHATNLQRAIPMARC